MKKALFALFLCVGLFMTNISAQTTTTPTPAKPAMSATLFSGQIGTTFEKNNVFFTCGGPNAKVSYKQWGAYIGAFPSLRYRFEKTIPANAARVFTMLGAGAGISYKRYNLIYIAFFPPSVAGATSPPKTIHSFGVAFKLGK
jgi:hypothetical protein